MITNREFQDNNNSIQVHWEDTLDNYSLPREKEIETYFKKKYKTDKVKVIFNALLSKRSADGTGGESMDGTADASEMVLDENYQVGLIKKYMTENNISMDMAYILRLDGTVNGNLTDYKDNTSRYKQFKIKWIEFENFFAYGKGNKLVLEGKPGITAVVSDPVNYGGKTTATIDLMLFLFFGETTKSDKNVEIFNRHSNADTVMARGSIEMEGGTYLIERKLTRTPQKSGEYKVSSSLEFQLALPRGGYKNLNGDEKKVTEQLINTYVGTKDDFLITILSTGQNLDDMIETKPTERGRILTRFIGLEFFREKEKIAKKLYGEWKETSKLHKHSLESINKNVTLFEETIEDTLLMKMGADKELKDAKEVLELAKIKRETVEAKRIPIDIELYKVNETEIEAGINTLNQRISEREAVLLKAEADCIKPEKTFNVDRLGILERKVQEMGFEEISIHSKINQLELTNRQLKESENCPSCKRPLAGVDNTAQIEENLREIKTLGQKVYLLNTEKELSLSEIGEIKQTKVLWDEFNKKELVATKLKMDLEQLRSSLRRGTDKLNAYRLNKGNVESNRLIEQQLFSLKVELEGLEDNKDMLLLKCKGYEKDVENAKKRIEEYKLLLKEIKREEFIDKVYNTYLEIYGKNGISKMVLSTMIPLINHHLRVLLSDSAEFVLELKMNDKNEVDFWMVDEATDVLTPLKSGSGYEKTVSSLALRCVLTKVCSLPKPNIIVFDEVFSRVGNENLDKIGLFFEKLKKHFENIWLISHNPLITEWADQLVKIRKKNKISELISD